MALTVLGGDQHSLSVELTEVTDIAPMLNWCLDNLLRDTWGYVVDKSDSPSIMLISIYSRASIALWKLTWL